MSIQKLSLKDKKAKVLKKLTNSALFYYDLLQKKVFSFIFAGSCVEKFFKNAVKIIC